MIRTFQAMRHVQPGFTRPEEAQTLTVSIPNAQIEDPEKVLRTEQAIQEKIAAVPGVAAVSFGTSVPMNGMNQFDPVFAEDHPPAEGKLPPVRRFKFAAPGFLKTLGNPLLAGRDFTWNETYSMSAGGDRDGECGREYWAQPAAALGKRLRVGTAGPWREIIGVVGNERDEGVERPASTTVYWPLLTKGFWGPEVQVRRTVTYVVRSSRTGSEGFLKEIRQAVWSVSPDLPLAGVKTLQEIYTRSMARTSFALVMLAIAGGMALLLGVIGIYGVISYSVSQRTREIGIRMALGAQRPALTSMFVRHGLRLVGIGLCFGLVAAFALTRAMSSLLFGISAADPMTYAGVSLGLARSGGVGELFAIAARDRHRSGTVLRGE